MNRRLAIRTMFGVRLGTTDVTEYRLLPVSGTEASAPLLRFRLLFLDFGTEQYDQRARFAFDRTRCLNSTTIGDRNVIIVQGPVHIRVSFRCFWRTNGFGQ